MDNLILEGLPSKTTGDLFDFLRVIKSREMRTNATLTSTILQDMYSKGAVWINIGTFAAVVLCQSPGRIVRLYYYAKDDMALSEIPRLMPKIQDRIISDVIGKEPKVGMQVQELKKAGLEPYAKFQQMICSKLEPDSSLDLQDVELAKPGDAKEILEITCETFDPLTARIPSLETLLERISAHEVLLIRRNGHIAGFTSFVSHNKRVALLDHVIVRPEYRREKIARKILYYKWKNLNQSKYYILWINVLCSEPIHYHETNGFHVNGIYDYILAYKS